MYAPWTNWTRLLDKLNAYAETNTAIVKKTPVKRRLPPLAD